MRGAATDSASPDELKQMALRSQTRLGEFRGGLRDIARSTPFVTPVWGEIGL